MFYLAFRGGNVPEVYCNKVLQTGIKIYCIWNGYKTHLCPSLPPPKEKEHILLVKHSALYVIHI